MSIEEKVEALTSVVSALTDAVADLAKVATTMITGMSMPTTMQSSKPPEKTEFIPPTTQKRQRRTKAQIEADKAAEAKKKAAENFEDNDGSDDLNFMNDESEAVDIKPADVQAAFVNMVKELAPKIGKGQAAQKAKAIVEACGVKTVNKIPAEKYVEVMNDISSAILEAG